jgi:4-amino-4-deoxy-L-arabinose transferase-like glycosyltransferase
VLRTGRRRRYQWFALISVASLVAPVVWILTHDLHATPTGDAFYFHWQARFIADGSGWFISPFPSLSPHVVVPSAEHPPLWSLVLALSDVLGLKSYPSQLLGACFIGAGAVFVTGLAAREVAGERTGLIAAGIAAVYPNYWINDTLGLSETLILLLVAAVILVAAKLWKKPSLHMTADLGLLCGLAAVTRAEQVLLIAVLLVPLILLLRGVAVRDRLRFLAVGVLIALVVIAPWVGFNLSRFSHRTLLSNDSGTALAMANCRSAYYKAYIGSGDFHCLNRIRGVPGDESAQDAQNRRVALRYIRGHLSRLPMVLAARPAREFGLYRPLVQLRLERDVNGRPLIIGEIGLGMYYALALAALYGALVLRRRGMTLLPFGGILLELVVAAMLTFGQTRYRAPIEVVLVVLGAVGLDALVAGGVLPSRRRAALDRVSEERSRLSVSS